MNPAQSLSAALVKECIIPGLAQLAAKDLAIRKPCMPSCLYHQEKYNHIHITSPGLMPMTAVIMVSILPDES